MLLSLSTLLFANFALGIAYPYYASSDYHQVQNGVKRRTYVPAAIPSHTDRRFHQKSFNPHDPNCQHSDNIFDLNSMWQPAEHTNYVYQNQMPPSPQATWPPQYHAPICATYPFCPQAQQTNTLPRTHTYLLYQGQPTYSLVQQQPQKRRFYYLTNVQNYQPNYEGQFIYARPAVTFRTAPKVPEPEVKLPDPDDARFITQGPETDEDDFTPTTEGPAVTQTAAPSVRPTARTNVPEDEETETSTLPSTDDYKDTSETTPGAETTATKEAKETEVKIKPASADDDDDDDEDVLEDKFANDQVTTGPTATGQGPEVTTRPPLTPTQVQEGEGETGGDSLPEPDEEDTDDDDKKEVAEGRATADSDPDTETSPETAAEPEGEKPEIAEAKDDDEKDDEEKDEEEKDEDDDEKDEDSGSTLTVIRPADQLSPALKQQIEDLKRKDKEDREAKALEDSEEKFVDDEDDGQAETQEGQAEGQSGQEATEKPEEAAPTTAEARRGDLGDDYDY